jgi:peptidoglycan/xylan/chitin deacetylase (PgdA/CDA1 family)
VTTAPESTVPILMYHQVSETPQPDFAKYTVTKRAFAAQMKWLASAGYTAIDLPALVAHRRDQLPLPEQPVVITFDDGFRDCAEIAGPVLASHGLAATFFLVAGLMGRSSHWLVAERGIELPLMSWEDARALERAGHHCESHSMTHPRLGLVSASECRAELARSRATIEAELGHPVRCLAYPFGSENQQVRDLAADCGYEAACAVTIGLSTAADDPLALRRVPVLGSDSLLDFISRLRTGFTVRDRLSALARSVVGATSRSDDA